jgi:hypothetical protein
VILHNLLAGLIPQRYDDCQKIWPPFAASLSYLVDWAAKGFVRVHPFSQPKGRMARPAAWQEMRWNPSRSGRARMTIYDIFSRYLQRVRR